MRYTSSHSLVVTSTHNLEVRTMKVIVIVAEKLTAYVFMIPKRRNVSPYANGWLGFETLKSTSAFGVINRTWDIEQQESQLSHTKDRHYHN